MSRPPMLRASLEPHELVVDNFAGGGGASTGIEAALGRPVDLAINHDPEAIAVHRANHPETRHFCESVWEVDPREACGSRPVGLAWFSPDCTHFSRAKGTKPLRKEIRGLAWVVIRWARAVRPRVIILENVEEFQTWGPLTEDGRPDKGRAGETFRAWLAELVGLGYSVEFRSLVAADYGAPTTRKRLFLVARRDGAPRIWPEATHGDGRQPWRAAAEIIDWSLPCPSIFERARPLAEATMRRIAAGVRRYVIEAGEPFLVKYHGGPRDRVQSVDEPLRTIDTARRFALISPTLVQTGYGERPGQAPRVPGLNKPLGTLVNGQKHGLVAAFLSKHYGDPDRKAGGGRVIGQALEGPIGTVTAKDHHSLVSAFLVKYYGSGGEQQGLFDPLHTVTAKARFGLVYVHGEPYRIADIGLRMLQPHELFAAQGFPETYEIAPEVNGKRLTKTAQIRLAGNSVCPPVSEQLVAANMRGGEARAA